MKTVCSYRFQPLPVEQVYWGGTYVTVLSYRGNWGVPVLSLTENTSGLALYRQMPSEEGLQKMLAIAKEVDRLEEWPYIKVLPLRYLRSKGATLGNHPSVPWSFRPLFDALFAKIVALSDRHGLLIEVPS